MVHRTVVEVRRPLGLGPDAVDGLLGRWVSTTVAWSRLTTLEPLGLDQMALTRGPGNSVAGISSRDPQGQLAVLALLPDRLKPPVKAFLEAIPAPLKATIQTACTDMADGAVPAVEEVLPGVTVGVDRFHVAPSYRASGEQLRNQERQRLKPDRPAVEDEPLKGVLGRGRPDWTALSEAEPDRLLPLFRHSPALQQTYCWRHLLTGIVNSSFTKAQAPEARERWGEQVRARGVHGFAGVLTTRANWREEISHYFLPRQRSGGVDGLNHKLQGLKRRWYGLDSGKMLFQRRRVEVEGYR